MMHWIATALIACAVLALGSKISRNERADRKTRRTMAQIDDKLAALDVATSLVAAELVKLRTDIEANGVRPEHFARMDAIAASLTAMAADPADVVPVPVPVA